MRILYLPLIVHGGASEQKFLAQAFRVKHEVQVFDYYNHVGRKDEKLLELVHQFRPDVIHCQFQGTRYIEPSVFSIIKIYKPTVIITQWTGDVRPEPIKEMVEYGKYMDITFVNSIDDVAKYREAGLSDVRFMMNAADVSQLGSPPSRPTGIIFTGAYNPNFEGAKTRRQLVDTFFKEFGGSFEVWGFGWEKPPKSIPWDNLTQHYEKAYLILGQNHLEGLEGWFSDRVFIAMASGRPFLCQYSRNLENYFDINKDMVVWQTVDEAVEKARWLLKNPVEAEKIGKQGQKTIRKFHLWQNRAEEFEKQWNAL